MGWLEIKCTKCGALIWTNRTQIFASPQTERVVVGEDSFTVEREGGEWCGTIIDDEFLPPISKECIRCKEE